jgi:hypothetical protein
LLWKSYQIFHEGMHCLSISEAPFLERRRFRLLLLAGRNNNRQRIDERRLTDGRHRLPVEMEKSCHLLDGATFYRLLDLLL